MTNSRRVSICNYVMQMTLIRDQRNNRIIRVQAFTKNGVELFPNYFIAVSADEYTDLHDPSVVYECWDKVANVGDDQYEAVYNEFNQATKKFLDSSCRRIIADKVSNYFKNN